MANYRGCWRRISFWFLKFLDQDTLSFSALGCCVGYMVGFVWHGFGGMRHKASGQSYGNAALSRIKDRAVPLAGSFAVWGLVFSSFDCTFTYIRKKEDPWNAIMSGAATGGVLAARAGVKAMGRNAIAGGVILAAIEGVSLMLTRVIMPSVERSAQQAANATVDKLLPPRDPTRKWNTVNRITSRNHPSYSMQSSTADSTSRSLPKWDTPGFAESKDHSGNSSDSDDSKKSAPSSWRLW